MTIPAIKSTPYLNLLPHQLRVALVPYFSEITLQRMEQVNKCWKGSISIYEEEMTRKGQGRDRRILKLLLSTTPEVRNRIGIPTYIDPIAASRGELAVMKNSPPNDGVLDKFREDKNWIFRTDVPDDSEQNWKKWGKFLLSRNRINRRELLLIDPNTKKIVQKLNVEPELILKKDEILSIESYHIFEQKKCVSEVVVSTENLHTRKKIIAIWEIVGEQIQCLHRTTYPCTHVLGHALPSSYSHKKFFVHVTQCVAMEFDCITYTSKKHDLKCSHTYEQVCYQIDTANKLHAYCLSTQKYIWSTDLEKEQKIENGFNLLVRANGQTVIVDQFHPLEYINSKRIFDRKNGTELYRMPITKCNHRGCLNLASFYQPLLTGSTLFPWGTDQKLHFSSTDMLSDKSKSLDLIPFHVLDLPNEQVDGVALIGKKILVIKTSSLNDPHTLTRGIERIYRIEEPILVHEETSISTPATQANSPPVAATSSRTNLLLRLLQIPYTIFRVLANWLIRLFA